MVNYIGDSSIMGIGIAGASGLAIGGGLGYYAGKRSARKKSKSRKKSTHRSSRKRNNKHSSMSRKQKQPHTAGKRKDTSHRRIRWTKNNRPYIIKGNGKARFISMKSVKQSKKRKGGKY